MCCCCLVVELWALITVDNDTFMTFCEQHTQQQHNIYSKYPINISWMNKLVIGTNK